MSLIEQVWTMGSSIFNARDDVGCKKRASSQTVRSNVKSENFGCFPTPTRTPQQRHNYTKEKSQLILPVEFSALWRLAESCLRNNLNLSHEPISDFI